MTQTTVTKIARLLWADRKSRDALPWAKMDAEDRAPWETLAVVALDAARGLRERVSETDD
jgi:hypothetical protein